MDSRTGRLPNFPISFFAVVMGLSGLTIGWMKLQTVSGVDLAPFNGVMTALTSCAFAAILITYAAKLCLYPGAVLEELRHQVKLNFFPMISVSLLLLSIVYIPLSTDISFFLWGAGTVLHFCFTLYVVSIWMHHRLCEIQHMNPAWLIPAVGNVIVPVAGVHHGFVEVSWFFFSVGMMFWIILMTVIMYRILFHNPIADRLMPTLFILIAPPSVGFISYVNLSGEVDAMARFLLYAGLFLTVLLLLKIRRFLRLTFFLSWWAYSFPLAAISIANLLMFEKTGMLFFFWAGTVLLSLLSVIVIFLTVRTVRAVVAAEICQPGH